MSDKITKQDSERLGDNVHNYISGMLECGHHCKPKPHHMTHYERTISKVGPLKHLSMMRYESKHRQFTDMAKETRCFINIAKSLAHTHQERLFFSGPALENNIQASSSSYPDASFRQQYETLLRSGDISIENLMILKFLHFNGSKYQPELFVIKDEKLFQIIHVLQTGQRYSLLCQRFEVINYTKSLNSVEIKRSTDQAILIMRLAEILNDKSYHSFKHDQKLYLIAENLSVFKLAPVTI